MPPMSSWELWIELHWEHRSFKEQWIDKEPTIHIGAVAKQELHNAQYAKIKNAAVNAKNEVIEMIERVQGRMGRLALPIVSAKYLAKIPNRDKVQDIGNASRGVALYKLPFHSVYPLNL